MMYIVLVCGMCRVQLCPIIPSARSIIVDRLRGDYMYGKSRSCSTPTRVPAAPLSHHRLHFQVCRVANWSTSDCRHPRRCHSAKLCYTGNMYSGNTLRERSRT